MTLIQKEAQRRASELQAHLADAKKAKKLDRGGYLEHAIFRQMIADGILWGMEHQRNLTATDAAADDDSLDDAVPAAIDK